MGHGKTVTAGASQPGASLPRPPFDTPAESFGSFHPLQIKVIPKHHHKRWGSPRQSWQGGAGEHPRAAGRPPVDSGAIAASRRDDDRAT